MVELTLHFQAEKVHSVRYQEIGTAERPQGHSFYIQKDVLPTPFPKTIKVSIEAINE